MRNKMIFASIDSIAFDEGRKAALLDSVLARADMQRMKQTGEAKRKTRKRTRTWMAAAACLMLLLCTLACIPKTRAAMLAWFNQTFRIGDYIATSPEERAAVPDVEDAIEPVGEEETFTTVFLAQEYEAALGNFFMQIDEAVCDGQAVYLYGTLRANPQIPMDDQNDGIYQPRTFYRYDCTGAYMDSYTLLNYVNKDDYISDDWDGCGDPYSQSYYDDLANGELGVSMQLDLPQGVDFTGEQGVTLSVLFGDFDWSDVLEKGEPVASIARFDVHFSFNADTGEFGSVTVTQSETASCSPTGGASLFFKDWESMTDETIEVRNERVDLAGMLVTLESLKQHLSGMDITLRVHTPENWTDEQKLQFLQQLDFRFPPDGWEGGAFTRAYQAVAYDENDPEILTIVGVPILQSDLDGRDSIAVQIMFRTMVNFNGAEIPEDGGVTAPSPEQNGNEGGWTQDEDFSEIENGLLEIPLS